MSSISSLTIDNDMSSGSSFLIDDDIDYTSFKSSLTLDDDIDNMYLYMCYSITFG